jgi:hypothetical protein
MLPPRSNGKVQHCTFCSLLKGGYGHLILCVASVWVLDTCRWYSSLHSTLKLWYHVGSRRDTTYFSCSYSIFYDMVDLHCRLQSIASLTFFFRRYAAAADQGCTKSLCNLGVIYIKGAENIPKNDVLAVKYLKKGNFPPQPRKLLHIALKMPQLLVLEIS